jgi:hypothetical protein
VRIVAALLLLALFPASASAAQRARTVDVPYPAALDATLARATFTGAGRLRADVGPTGAFGHVTVGTAGRMRALVLVINRRPIQAPSIQIADPASIATTFRARRLSRPRVVERPGLLAHVGSPAGGALCAPAGPRVRVLADTGAAFAYPPDQALVQALNAACGRPVDPAFTAAVQQEPQPTPVPPPRCPPCNPRPGIACPAQAAVPAIACVQP